ncbi:hypothetical protein Tco_0645768 [Tanacetum coccineum]
MEMASTEVDALWRKLVKSFYEPNGTFSSSSVRNMRHGTWCDIINALYSIDDIDPSNGSDQECKVSDRWGLTNGVWVVYGLGDFLWEVELWMTSHLLFPQLAAYLYLCMMYTNGLVLVMLVVFGNGEIRRLMLATKDEDVFPSIQCLSRIWISAHCSSSLLDWGSNVGALFVEIEVSSQGNAYGNVDDRKGQGE